MLDTISTQRRSAIASQVKDLLNTRGPMPAFKKGQLQSLLAEAESLEPRIAAEYQEEEMRVFDAYLRRGINGIKQEHRGLIRQVEIRDMIANGLGAYPGNVTGIGVFLPVGFDPQVSAAQKLTGAMLGIADAKEVSTGRLIANPEVNDTGVSGEQLLEDQQASTGDIQNVSQVIQQSYIYSTKIIKVANTLVQDAGFDLPGFLAEQFGIRLARVTEPAFIGGVGGTTQPYGIVTQAQVAGVAVGSVSNDGVGGFNTIGTDDVTTLEQSVDPLYRARGTFLMNPSTLASLGKVKDKEGRPVFRQLDDRRLLGYPIALSYAVDQLQTQSSSPAVTRNTLLFGDFNYYKIRYTPRVLIRMVSRFADQNATGFLILQRYAGALIDGGGGAVKTLQNVG